MDRPLGAGPPAWPPAGPPGAPPQGAFGGAPPGGYRPPALKMQQPAHQTGLAPSLLAVRARYGARWPPSCAHAPSCFRSSLPRTTRYLTLRLSRSAPWRCRIPVRPALAACLVALLHCARAKGLGLARRRWCVPPRVRGGCRRSAAGASDTERNQGAPQRVLANVLALSLMHAPCIACARRSKKRFVARRPLVRRALRCLSVPCRHVRRAVAASRARAAC